MTGDDEVVEHDVPQSILGRLLGLAFGAFMVVNAGQTVANSFYWMVPNSLMENVFLFLQFVAGAVLIICALVVPVQRWTVQRGLVRIESRSLFRSWHEEFGPDDVKEFDLIRGSDEGSATWSVVLRTRARKSVVGRSLGNEQDAIKLFLDMRRVFYGDTLPKFYGPPA